MTSPVSVSNARSPLTALWLLLAALLLQACSARTASEGSQVVATVNKNEISVHQINQVLQRQQGLPAEQAEAASRQVLERLIEQEVAVQQALEMKLDRDPAVMQNIAAARREVLARAYGARVAESAPKPDSADLQAYFDARPTLFAQRKLYALQEFAVQADQAQVDALGRFVATAKSLNEVTDYLRAQKLGVRANQSTQPAENLPPALLERLAAMKDGQLLLLAAPAGARIIVLAGTRAAPVVFEQARAPIEQALLAERRRLAVQSKLDAARKDSDIQYRGAFAMAATAPAANVARTAPATATATAPTAPTTRPATTSAASPFAALPAPAASIQTPTTSTDDSAMVNKGLAGLK